MKKWLKIILVLFVTGIIAALLILKFYIYKPQPDYEKLKADYSMTAQDLYNDFKNEPAKANGTYLGKMIEINGKISKIETPDSLVIAVFVFDQGDFGDMGLRCTMLKKYNEKAGTLKTDEQVRIKGYCTGYNEGSDVIMEQCSIQ